MNDRTAVCTDCDRREAVRAWVHADGRTELRMGMHKDPKTAKFCVGSNVKVGEVERVAEARP